MLGDRMGACGWRLSKDRRAKRGEGTQRQSMAARDSEQRLLLATPILGKAAYGARASCVAK